jgi:hypothetical protein
MQAVFHNYIDGHKHDVFNGGAEVLMGQLSTAAETIGKALNESLRELAEKVRLFCLILAWASFILHHRLKCHSPSSGKAHKTSLIKLGLDCKLSSLCLSCSINW